MSPISAANLRRTTRDPHECTLVTGTAYVEAQTPSNPIVPVAAGLDRDETVLVAHKVLEDCCSAALSAIAALPEVKAVAATLSTLRGSEGASTPPPGGFNPARNQVLTGAPRVSCVGLRTSGWGIVAGVPRTQAE